MQYVACKFRSTDTRSFTYHWDGDEEFAVGDMVKVPDRSGDGWKRVEVVSITDEAPPFPTKPILGKLEPEPEAPAAETEKPSVDWNGMVDADGSNDPLSDEIPW